eukprot:TRINITY_DN8472_c0_g1_i2.p1 TRINITY_DN8472_c0_g1~~TRINITY_DN8472_c0_g1_i2.p1  ORF type:complete len:917 (+),score=176.92 TRINITY_DN8472_c0_g1_i2:70-2820(+)
MPPPLTLAEAVSTSNSSASQSGQPIERIRWLECFTDKENVSEFCESTDPSGNLESNSSSGHKEYQDRLRAIAFRQEGLEKAEIAEAIGRSTKFVQTWWQKDQKQVPKPPGVHDYLKTEFWRDIEIVRGFGKGLGVYEDALQSTEWVQPMADGREFKNGGGYRLKYDKEGRMRPQGNQNAKDGVVPGRLPKLDKLIQRVCVEQKIDDRVLKRPGLLWYPDGNSDAIVHRHEAWTALMSFGAPRILTIDNHPVLLRDGDLIVFGTQRHGVPKMCQDGSTFDDYGGRMSVVMFFMPTGQQASGSEPWRAIRDDGPSRKMTAMLRDSHLGSGAQIDGLLNGSKSAELKQLTDLGFDAAESAAALRATGFDLALATEALLNGSGPALLLDDRSTGCCTSRSSQIAALWARLQELQLLKKQSTQASGSAAGSAAIEDDEALAARLQHEEEGHMPSSDWEERAILELIEDLEREEGGGQAALAAQFDQYEEMLDAADAEEWDGRGDLMVREWRRQHLHIEQQEPSTCYGFGCGNQNEKAFFELLSLHSIRVLYDFRVDAEQVGSAHFKPGYLEGACKRHSIHYRYAPLGRDGAYGILKHLREDEGRNLLAELVWWARRKRTAFLGFQDDWQHDRRLAIATRLREAGHRVLHVEADGSTKEHPEHMELPDFILGEEAKLRMIEKQRLAGDLKRPQKSAVSRSTESIAQRLTRPQQEIDAGAELRKANTQAELCRIQRRLADLQRRSEDSDAKAGLGPKLMYVNKWVKAEAAKQQENIAAGLTKDGKDKSKIAAGGSPPAYAWTSSGGTAGGNPDFSSASSGDAHPPSEVTSLMVECLSCGASFPWASLASGDGQCTSCLQSLVAAEHAEALLDDSAAHRQTASSSEVAEDVSDMAKPSTSAPRWARRRLERENAGASSSSCGHG